MKVKFVDLNKLHKPILSEINESINKVIEKSDFINGEEVKIFEERWAKYTNQKYAIGVSSGYSALKLSNKALLHWYCSNVIIPTNSFIATANAFYDKHIYFTDSDKYNHLINYSYFKDMIFNCIVPVHLYGQPANIKQLLKLRKSEKIKFKIIEDACQAHGVSNKLIGQGDATCYSFYPSKNLGCFGDGGMITTNNKEIANKLYLLRSYGENPKNNHNVIGYNDRLDTIQAAILNVKLDYLDEWNNKRREISKQYHEKLENINNVHLLPYNKNSVYHLFVIEIINSSTNKYVIENKLSERHQLIQYLRKNKIETGIHYPIPIHKQKAYEINNNLSMPNAEHQSLIKLSLPIHPNLDSAEVSYVCNKIKDFYESL